MVSTFRSPPTARRIASSAISFRLPPASISAAASSRFTSVFRFRFRLSLGRPFHDSSSLPFHFLTPAVSAFFRPPQFWILTTQLSALSFPFFPFSPVGGSSGASFLFRPACFHAFLPIPVLSLLHFFSPITGSPHSGYFSASAFFLSASGFFPFAFALGSGYSALGPTLTDNS